MSHFYGTLQGARGKATRRGHKTTGLVTIAASWRGAIQVCLRYDVKSGEDIAAIYFVPWHGNGRNMLIYAGPVSGEGFAPQEKSELKEHQLKTLAASVVSKLAKELKPPTRGRRRKDIA